MRTALKHKVTSFVEVQIRHCSFRELNLLLNELMTQDLLIPNMCAKVLSTQLLVWNCTVNKDRLFGIKFVWIC